MTDKMAGKLKTICQNRSGYSLKCNGKRLDDRGKNKIVKHIALLCPDKTKSDVAVPASRVGGIATGRPTVFN